MVSEVTPHVHPYQKAPARASSLRGWDIFNGIFFTIIMLSVMALNYPVLSWAAPMGTYVVWYILVGRRALNTGSMFWARLYASGTMVLLFWGAVSNSWIDPWIGIFVPLIWWLFLPNRRAAVLWTVAQCAGMVAGLLVFQSITQTEQWSAHKTVVYLVGYPILIIVGSIIGGRWADAMFNWGRERTTLVNDLRLPEEQRIALAMEAAAAEERLHMAQEIHDTVAQDVAGLRLLVERACRQVEVIVTPRVRPLAATLGMIATAADTLLTQTRVLITTTMPPLDSSFQEAIERIVSRFSKETGVVIDASISDARLAREAEVVFVRCLQEGLSNVRKHSQATQVWVSISVVGEIAVMTLTDNGVGMAQGASQGFGLPGMAERVRLAGGSFTIESPGPMLGVTMRVRMPVNGRDGVPIDAVQKEDLP